ncbi:hypothetical protein [Cronobacter dublinensis]|uniref:hypothetical protein n=1 Tax=Cronobacter dublinensis TaxID=413497 RepID=UPI0024AF8C5D|nr:hypothetical protein [Cronobacter dublinensis]MDI7504513.1 hypothetical protein [Cronobacter dublinensis]
MAKKEDGGMAFPAPATEWSDFHTGMSLRDYFAAKALCALLSNNSEDAEVRVQNGAKHVAARAYDMADAMLKVREEE